MRKVAIAGHICVDLTPELGSSARLDPGALVDVGPLAFTLGGCVANTARTLSDMGHPVTAYATVGDDELGRVVRAKLGSDRVRACITTRAVATSYSLVLQPQDVDRTFWHHVGANGLTDGREVDLDDADLLHLGYPSLLPALIEDDGIGLVELLARARRAGVTTSIDLAVVDPASRAAQADWSVLLRAIAAGADILTPSLDDLTSVLSIDSEGDEDLAELLADLLVSWGAGIVVISAGPRGLVMRTASRRRLAAGGRALEHLAAEWAALSIRMPAIPVESVRTTNGAGDASTAGLLYGISRGLPASDALRIATACSAAVVSGRPATVDNVIALAPELDDVLRPGPVVLSANQPAERFYRGGAQVAQFRMTTSSEPFTPEDWVGSTVCVRDGAPAGLTTLPDGRLLRDAVASDPRGWLGEAHVARYGTDPMLLVKLLDAGQRLPVHVHPDADFAHRHLGASHGKAEAWHILTPGVVYLGLKRDVSSTELARLVDSQDTDTLLALLHQVSVEPGDRVFVPAGVLHAIGEGVLLVEVQEPEDLSILLEWRGFAIDGAKHGHLGLGLAEALTAVDRSALEPARLADLIRRDGGVGLPPRADAFFRLERLEVDGAAHLDPGFVVLIGLEGDIALAGAFGIDIARGSTVLIPAAHGAIRLEGAGVILVARPPIA